MEHAELLLSEGKAPVGRNREEAQLRKTSARRTNESSFVASDDLMNAGPTWPLARLRGPPQVTEMEVSRQ